MDWNCAVAQLRTQIKTVQMSSVPMKSHLKQNEVSTTKCRMNSYMIHYSKYTCRRAYLADDEVGAWILALLHHVCEISFLLLTQNFKLFRRVDVDLVLCLGLGRFEWASQDGDTRVLNVLIHLWMADFFVQNNAIDQLRVFKFTSDLPYWKMTSSSHDPLVKNHFPISENHHLDQSGAYPLTWVQKQKVLTLALIQCLSVCFPGVCRMDIKTWPMKGGQSITKCIHGDITPSHWAWKSCGWNYIIKLVGLRIGSA